MTGLPLAGLTVLSLEHAVAAPFATRQLADLGARVIKVERPGAGDFARRYDEAVGGLSSYFVWLNRSKESLTLDVKSPEGVQVLRQLLTQSDVLVHNLGPGAAQRLGLAHASLETEHPRLISCAISGYGSDGPWSDRRAYDLLVQAESGLLSTTGSEHDVAKVGVSVADIAAGMYAFSGILTALVQRGATGCGANVEISLFEAIAEWMGQPMHYTAGSGEQPPRLGAHHATIAPYGPYAAADGRTLLLAVQNDREFERLCSTFLGAPHLSADDRFVSNTARVRHRADLDEVLRSRFDEIGSDEAERQLSACGIATARVNDVRGLLEHEALSGRDRWRDVGVPGGTVRSLLPPISIDGAEARMGPIPEIGEHTDPILVGLGYSMADIDKLRRRGVV